MHPASRHAVALLAISLTVTPQVSGQCPDCGPEAILENEPNCGLDAAGGYDDFTNGGCSAVEPRFTPIELGQTICGTVAMDTITGVRDTDWYELVLAEETDLVWLLSADFRSLTGIVDNAGVPDCDAASCFVTYAVIGECYPFFWYNVQLPAGTWWFYVAPGFNQDDVGCEFRYTSRVIVRHPADLNGDGIVNVYDLSYLIYYWGPVYDWTPPQYDLDGDGLIGILDLLLLLGLWPT